ncbi:fibronectin type 3 and ankyrin repeat domains protein 1-like isoform X2 [Centruroides vittatus]|uniref:fibronectin type 3 and ankyrin repeat domains protein 1-like isoform X2 n=1 Tax=Centruroides vittatus TaxID=120091 RepID=UPI0035108A2E
MDEKDKKIQSKKSKKVKTKERKTSDFKNLIQVDEIELPSPQAPICTAVTFNSISLQWDQDDPSDDKLYIVQYSHQKKKWDTAYNGYAKSEIFKSLSPNTVFYFRVRYKKGMAESDWSNITEVTTAKEPLSMLDLHRAVQSENLSKVINILEKDEHHQLKIDSPDHYGLSVLMRAILRNCNEIAEVLIKHGADINYSDASGRNCLMTACFIGNLEATKLLRKLGCKWTTVDKFGNTPLHCAVEGNSLEVIKWAIKDGADIHATDKNGLTPLLKHALNGGSSEITKLLILEGANIDAQDIYGNTALILATVRNNPEIVRELIANNCDWSLPSYYNRTAIEIAESLDRRVR